ncbi:uncharacterized protein LOC119399396 [Rhipicephalus sanguineus]|uniref:uncharacterized protein LOC119399396 n=1 Tax=Rhipicephalus sanguineus TaxID=34632 RepID=UPI001895FB60|nr:uncharacterized protein LOC119399396 [Rhipicephalus sanguineus]
MGKEEAVPCAVIGCKASDRKGVKTRHVLPKDDALRSAWLQRIGLPSTHTRKRIRVCGRHFARDAYVYDQEVMKHADVGWSCTRLKSTALPTLFLPGRQHDNPPHRGGHRQVTSAAASCDTQAEGSREHDNPPHGGGHRHVTSAAASCDTQAEGSRESGTGTSELHPSTAGIEASCQVQICKCSSPTMWRTIATQAAIITKTVSTETSHKETLKKDASKCTLPYMKICEQCIPVLTESECCTVCSAKNS